MGNIRKILIFILFVFMFLTTLTIDVNAANERKIVYNDSQFTYVPYDTYYINNKQYKKYIVIEYEGLENCDIIFVDANDYLVTDKELLKKLTYMSMVTSNIVIAKDTKIIVDYTNELIPALDVIDKLGNDLIDKTITNSIVSNFNAICSVFTANPVEYAKEYASFVYSAGVDATLYLSYLMTLNDLTNLAINNMNKLLSFNDDVTKYIHSRGISYEEVLSYEKIVRNCISSIKTTQDYIYFLTECVSNKGDGSTFSRMLSILTNVSLNIIDDELLAGTSYLVTKKNLGSLLAEKFGESMVDAVTVLKDFNELMEASNEALKVNEKLLSYYNNYALYDESSNYYLDINDIVNTVEKLVGKIDNNQDDDNNQNSNDTEKTQYDGGIYSQNSTISAKIEQILDKYQPGHSYFTKNGKACTSCHSNNTINCVNSPSACNCLRYVTIGGKKIDLASVQCLSYARYWQQILFEVNEFNNKSYFQKIGSISGTLTEAKVKTWFDNNENVLHPGTHIRVLYSGHSIVLLNVDYSNKKITYIDCNYSGKCFVSDITTISFASFASKFKTLNYAYVYKDYNTKYPEGNKLTIKYNVNGGNIIDDGNVNEIYKVTHKLGLNVRNEPSTSSTKLGAITQGTSITILEKKVQSDYTWGKINYKGKYGWVAIDGEWMSQIGTSSKLKYYVQDEMVFNISSSEVHKHVCSYGVVDKDGFFNDTTFGLTREGYEFVGWSLSRTGEKIYDQNKSFKPEEIAPSLSTGNKEIIVYAIWKEKIQDVEVNNAKCLNIISTPDKLNYFIGESFNIEGLVVECEYEDGTKVDVTKKLLYNYNFNVKGNNFVEISYENMLINLPVMVYEKPDIEIFSVLKVVSDQVEIPVTLQYNNDNISPIGYEINISFDTNLKFIGIAGTGDYNKCDINVYYTNNGLLINYEKDENLLIEDILFTLIFELNPDSSNNKKYEINITNAKLIDSLGNEFEVNKHNGYILNSIVKNICLNLTGNETIKKYEIDFGNEFEIPNEVPVKEGYKFLGWTTVEESGIIEYVIGDVIDCYEDLNLYPVWEELKNDNTNDDTTNDNNEDDDNTTDDNIDNDSDNQFSINTIINYIRNIDLSNFDKKDLIITILSIALILVLVFKRKRRQ